MSSVSSLCSRVRLVWHRRDLRLHDNAVYSNLIEKQTEVVSVYVFDDMDFQPRPSTALPQEWDAVTVGPHAGRILIEAVQELRESLRNIGGELLVRQGDPAQIIQQMISELGVTEVYYNEEPGIYEQHVSEKVWQSIRTCHPDVTLQTSMQYTLYHPDDLPSGETEWQNYSHPKRKKSKRKKPQQQVDETPSSFSGSERLKVSHNDNLVDISIDRWKGIPRIMGDFRRAARGKTRPRPCMQAPQQLSTPTHLPPPGDIPSIYHLYRPLMDSTRPLLGLSRSKVQETIRVAQAQLRANSQGADAIHRGGEQIALAHLADFCANHAASATRNLACVDNHESSHLSHFLAFGGLSPRKIIEEAEAHGESRNWLISHMTMRDFFLYTCLATGGQFYKLKGIPVNKKGSDMLIWSDWKESRTRQKWEQWALGETNLPLVDATMKELYATGYCSNRVRQNVASFLTKDLEIDWRAGAELFQFLLDDHCVGANWGNWLYFSGVGPDPKQRHFRTISQALKYDRNGHYVFKWLPELHSISGDEAFLRPWDFSDNWGQPIVSPETQYIWQDLERLKEGKQLIHPNEQVG